MTTLYIAGPMSGIEDFNYPAFYVAASQLESAGFTVLNPAANEAPNESPTWTDWMRLAIAQLIQADGIALLPGWRDSRGAQLEKELAVDLGLQVGTMPNWLTKASNEAHMARLLEGAK